MKILCVGDLHMKFEISYSSTIKDGRKKEWEDVKRMIHETAKKCDSIILLGDQLNSRHNHSSVLREFIDFLNVFGDKDIHILVGNHERYSTSTALDFLKSLNKPNWHIYTEPTLAKICGKTAMMIPFQNSGILGVETKEEGEKALMKKLVKADLAFIHHAITGAKSVEFFNEIVLDKDKISKMFGMVFSSHLHQAEKLGKNIQIVGSIFTQEVGEHSKSIFIWDTVAKTTKEISLPCRGIFKIVWEEWDRHKNIIPNHSIIKCYVTNKETDLEYVKDHLKSFDASVLIEQYPSERSKVHFEDGFDLSIDSLLKLYSDAKKMKYSDLKDGFELIK